MVGNTVIILVGHAHNWKLWILFCERRGHCKLKDSQRYLPQRAARAPTSVCAHCLLRYPSYTQERQLQNLIQFRILRLWYSTIAALAVDLCEPVTPNIHRVQPWSRGRTAPAPLPSNFPNLWMLICSVFPYCSYNVWGYIVIFLILFLICIISLFWLPVD